MSFIRLPVMLRIFLSLRIYFSLSVSYIHALSMQLRRFSGVCKSLLKESTARSRLPSALGSRSYLRQKVASRCTFFQSTSGVSIQRIYLVLFIYLVHEYLK